MNVIERIAKAMEEDYENLDKQSELLEELYEHSDLKGQALLNEAFICVCGWSLKTLLSSRTGEIDNNG